VNDGRRARIISFGLSIILLIVFVYFTKENIIKFADLDYWLIYFSIFLILSVIIYSVIHESGHVIFGWATGYKLDAFALFGYVFINSDNRYILKRVKIPGTAGANMMHYAKDKTSASAPYMLYVLGGVLTTGVATIISAISMKFINNVYVEIFLYTMVFVGLVFTVYNAIPTKVKGIYNDGMIVKLFKKDDRSQEIFNKAQDISLISLREFSIKDAPEELFEISESYKSAPFANELRVNRSEYLMYNERYREAELELEDVIQNLDESDKNLKDIATCFLLLEYLINNADKEKIERVYQDNKKDIESLARYNLTAKYISIAYKLKIEEDWNIDKEVLEFYKLSKRQDLGSDFELDLMKKLLNENSMSYLIQAD